MKCPETSELLERYHMSKQAFYITVEKYKDAVALADFMDKSKASKNIISDQVGGVLFDAAEV
jgi:hypothetical protein